jgi:hypothetical protein
MTHYQGWTLGPLDVIGHGKVLPLPVTSQEGLVFKAAMSPSTNFSTAEAGRRSS